MIYVSFIKGVAVSAGAEHPTAINEWQTRNDWHSMERAAEVATQLNAANLGTHYLPVDSGRNVSPRYDVIAAPALGDKVSYAFNGAYYPGGTITSISDSFLIITTSTGKRYFRRKLTASWVMVGGTRSLVPGRHNDKNPSF